MNDPMFLVAVAIVFAAFVLSFTLLRVYLWRCERRPVDKRYRHTSQFREVEKK